MYNKKVVTNIKWIIGCKIAQAVVNLFISMFSARYLGPSNYGLINYASSIVAFAIPVMQLGLKSTLVQEFIDNPHKEGVIIGTALCLNLVSAVACIIGVFTITSFINAGQAETIIVCILYSLSLIFSAIEMIQYWFQYKMLSKYSSLVMLGAYFAVSAYKLYILISHKNIYWFAVSHCIDYSIIGLRLFILYFNLGGQKLSFSWDIATKMFATSKYYILSSLMVTIFANTDRIMLNILSGEIETGYYSAAVSCAWTTGFVFSAIIDATKPVILSSKKISNIEFRNNISKLYCILIYMALRQGILFTLFSKLIINILYGHAFLPAADVLCIIVWYMAFSVIGTVRNIWILAEGLEKYLFVINMSGALSNIILNIFLIPFYAAKGAAIASLITQIFTNFILGFIFPPIKENNRIIIESLNPKPIKEIALKFINTKVHKH